MTKGVFHQPGRVRKVQSVIEGAGLDLLFNDVGQAFRPGHGSRCVAARDRFPAFLPFVLKIDSHGLAASFDPTHVNP